MPQVPRSSSSRAALPCRCEGGLRDGGPTLTRATPSRPRSATFGVPGTAITLSGASIARTRAAIVSASVTPGTKMQSAPAARYDRARRTVSSNRVSGAPTSNRKTSIRALITKSPFAARAASRACHSRSACSAADKSGLPSLPGESSRFIPAAPIATRARAVSATATGDPSP
jgi:hypothetical protein